MLIESFIAATLTANKVAAHTSAALKDVGIFQHEFQPQSTFRQGFKKSSSQPGCIAISSSHIFAAQADKAVINVYSRERGNQEATVPFPERITSLAYAHGAEILVLGSEGGRLILWEVTTGRVINSSASHLQAVSCLCLTPKNEYIISGSADTNIHVWSLLKLLSFTQQTDSYGNETPSNAPESCFSGHRSAITAVACGHSSITTNFAVSASDDGTCYVWHVETNQTLRTLLLPSPCVSIALDPADRVIYFGCRDGKVQSWDIFQSSSQSILSTSTRVPPIQLSEKSSWAVPSTDYGGAYCLTLSYDGTSLVSGHQNGSIIRWDVTKHRMLNEITNLAQPVTSIEMLRPDGLSISVKPKYTVTNVVKPILEFAAKKDNGSCGIPAKYNLHVAVNYQDSISKTTDMEDSIIGPGIPQAMLDAAVRAVYASDVAPSHSQPSNSDIAKAERLEDEVASLKQQLEALRNSDEKRRAKKLERMTRRDEIGLKKREAYFAAKRLGKDGDAAMKKWQQKEDEVDQESDDEALDDRNEMEIG
jgi:pre-rRNA-processing protein IPI3